MTTTAANPTATPSTRELVEVDPATLLVDLNVRHDTRLDADFCASIAEHGVLVRQPPRPRPHRRWGRQQPVAALDAMASRK